VIWGMIGTLIWGVILELMLNVISKIKQNSSDMNEIILAPCDAGYVQSCTGYRIGRLLLSTVWHSVVQRGTVKHILHCASLCFTVLPCASLF
jgi:hypothetical protein